MNNKDIRRVAKLITEDPDIFNESTDLINETDDVLRLLQREKGGGLEDLANYYRASKRHGEDLTGRGHEEDPIGQQVSRLNRTNPNAALIARIRSNRRLWTWLDFEPEAVWFQAPSLPSYMVTVYLPEHGFFGSVPEGADDATVFVEADRDWDPNLDAVSVNIGTLSQEALDYLVGIIHGEFSLYGEYDEDALEGEDRFYQELNDLYARFLQRGGLEHNE